MRNFSERMNDVLNPISLTLDKLEKKEIEYNIENSPLEIRSHLTYSSNQDFSNELRINNLIFLSSIKIYPDEMQIKSLSGNNFYITYFDEITKTPYVYKEKEFEPASTLFISLAVILLLIVYANI